MAEKSRSQQATIYVGGFDQQVTTESLENAFIPFGDIANIHLPKPDLPSSDAKHRGFAYVEFEDPEDAAEAIDNMDQSEMFGRVIKVMAAKPQKEQNKGRDGTISIWQQEGYQQKREAGEEAPAETTETADPMQGLEGLDVAGPKAA